MAIVRALYTSIINVNEKQYRGLLSSEKWAQGLINGSK